ncbi:MAG: hypothetical protein Kow00114_00820 [Kiloniellaceae bacterium]
MFGIEIPAFTFYARFSGLSRPSRRRSIPAMAQTPATPDPQSAVLDALAQMLPATAAEIAEVTGLSAAAAAACLDGLAARYRVMFNPLTKRYSLPKATRLTGVAA